MTVLVMIDAENCGLTTSRGEASKLGSHRRRKLILDHIADEAGRVAGGRSDPLRLKAHWADPMRNGDIAPFTRNLSSLLTKRGGEFEVHQRVTVRQDGRDVVQKNTADIGLAVDTVATVLPTDEYADVVLVAGDSDYIPLIKWLGRSGRRAHMLHINNRVSRHTKQAVRDSGGQWRNIGPALEASERAIDAIDDGGRVKPSEVSIEDLLPCSTEARLSVLSRLREVAQSHPAALRDVMGREFGAQIADLLAASLVSGGALSPLGSLVSWQHGSEAPVVDRALDWLVEAELVWAAAAMFDVMTRTNATETNLVAAMEATYDDPLLLTAAFARARLRARRPYYLRRARERALSIPADRETRREVLDLVSSAAERAAHFPAHLRNAADRTLRFLAEHSEFQGRDPDAATDLAVRDAAWIAHIVAVNDDQTQAELLGSASPIPEDLLHVGAVRDRDRVMDLIGEFVTLITAATQPDQNGRREDDESVVE